MAERILTLQQDDQAARLRQLMAVGQDHEPQPALPHHVIGVASGKGGVGKTMLAVNLSIALVAQGHKVVLLDMDMGLANADIILGVDAQESWSEVLSGKRTLREIVIPAPGGVDFVPGASGIAQLADLSEFERHRLLSAFHEIEARYDIVVLDCGAGISHNVMSFAAAADTMLVVTTPEPTAITDAYAMIKAFAQIPQSLSPARRPDGAVGLVVNNAAGRREARATYDRLAGVAARFLHLPVTDYGYILHDEHVSAAVRQRNPLMVRYPRCSAGSCLMAIAGRLSREIGPAQTRQNLFYRVMNLFS